MKRKETRPVLEDYCTPSDEEQAMQSTVSPLAKVNYLSSQDAAKTNGTPDKRLLDWNFHGLSAMLVLEYSGWIIYTVERGTLGEYAECLGHLSQSDAIAALVKFRRRYSREHQTEMTPLERVEWLRRSIGAQQ